MTKMIRSKTTLMLIKSEISVVAIAITLSIHQ
jgi:hypothetical protein